MEATTTSLLLTQNLLEVEPDKPFEDARWAEFFGFSNELQKQEIALLSNSATPPTQVELLILFRFVVEKLVNNFGFSQAGVYLLEGKRLTLQARAGTGKFPQYLSTDSAAYRQATHFANTRALKAFNPEVRLEDGILVKQAEIFVPLLYQEKVFGALYLKNWGESNFTKTDFSIIDALGNQLNFIIERLNLLAKARKSEWEYGELLANIKEVVFQLDLQERWVFLNPAWTAITGYEIEDSLGQKFAEYLHPKYQEISLKLEITLAEGSKESYQRELQIITRSGETRWIKIVAWPVCDQAGRVTSLAGTLEDITGYKFAQALEQKRNRVLEMVATNQELPEVFTQIVKLVEEQSSSGSGIALWLLKNGQLYCAASANLSSDYLATLNGFPVGPTAGSSGKAAYQGSPVFVGEIESELCWQNYRDLALDYGLKACWAMPIFSGAGRVLGTVEIYSGVARRPSSLELEVLETSSHLATIALEQHSLTSQLTYQAQHDTLTGLPNRALFKERLHEALVQAKLKKEKVALLFLDLDRFKFVNDTLGHQIGDLVLQQVATRLKNSLRNGDTLARMGGDEFTLILPEIRETWQVSQIAQRLLQALRTPFQLQGHELQLTTSIGISLYPDDGETIKELVSRADSAMYQVKKHGKNSYQFFKAELDTVIQERLAIELELGTALKNQQFFLHYQPQLDLKTGKLSGFEALLRWNHPKLGLVSPTRFIPIAEETGLILEIGQWVLEEACRQNLVWQKAGYGYFKVAVNVTALQLERLDFVETVKAVLARTGLAPHWLELELTESLLMQTNQQAIAKLEELRKLGVSLALDDFGTGYSSLSYLQQLPIDLLKIDRSFVKDLDEPSQPLNIEDSNPKCGNNKQAIVSAITTLAHSLGLKVVAEGVETKKQLRFLQRVGCDNIQGYLLSLPLPASELEKKLKKIIRNNPSLIKV